MANPEHLQLLRRGVQEWNEWRNNNSEVQIDLSAAYLARLDLTGANFSRANLNRTFFYGCKLGGCDFIQANAISANFSDSDVSDSLFYQAQLTGVDFSGANLTNVNFTNAHLKMANFSRTNLEKADFIKAYLNEANFYKANLVNVNFSQGYLSRAKFIQANATGANFEYSCLTSACIEDWQISHETNFNNVVSEAIFFKTNIHGHFIDRYPASPNNLAQGEFTRFIQIGLDTVEFVFDSGIDWVAFFASFQDLKQKFQPEEFSIRSFKKESNGRFIIRVNVPPETNKIELESEFYQKYREAVERLDSSYQQEFFVEYPDIETYRQQGLNFEEIIQRLANHPIPKNHSVPKSQE